MDDAAPTTARRTVARRWRDLLGLATGAALVGAGAWLWAAPSGDLAASVGSVPETTPVASAPAPTATPRTSQALGTSRPPVAVADPASVPILRPPTPAFAPTRLDIPAIGIASRVVPVTVSPDGEIGIPDDPAVLGWWRGGGRPASGVGSVVVVGHVDSATYGTGPLYRAVGLRVGDRATLRGPDGTTRTYRLAALRTYLKQTLPADQIFSQDVPERLVVVTCGGQYHRGAGGWDSNVVAYFTPVRG
ncbi:MAG: hypothetical protein GC157_18375 [Frankiales bacterium]|nr:hypothetical protein [Frankiales bacterium]